MVEYVGSDSSAVIKKENKWSLYVKIKGEVMINDKTLTDGLYKLEIKKMERTSGSKEYMGYKNILVHAEDKKKEVIEKFDRLVEEVN